MELQGGLKYFLPKNRNCIKAISCARGTSICWPGDRITNSWPFGQITRKQNHQQEMPKPEKRGKTICSSRWELAACCRPSGGNWRVSWAKTAGVAGENATNSLQLFRPPPLSFHPPPPLVALHAAAQLFKSTSHGCVAPAVG